MTKTLDRRLTSILAGSYKPDDFIIADAKDGDMGRGLSVAGPGRPGPDGKPKSTWVTRAEYVGDMEDTIRQGEIDILLCSVANAEVLSQRGHFNGPVTVAIRANDTTDVWGQRGSGYSKAPSRPYRSAKLPLVSRFCDLGLYSVTFNNDLDLDVATLDAYARFREEAERNHFRHFLEVFNPNAPVGLSPEQVPDFVNDCIHRIVSGLTRAERPVFLKVVYNGRRALEELVADDPSLVVGILGGGHGTTRDAFELLHQGAKYGARVALFGRKIQFAESPLDLVALMRPVVRGDVTPLEAVRAYHGTLEKKRLRPARPLDADSAITEAVLRG